MIEVRLRGIDVTDFKEAYRAHQVAEKFAEDDEELGQIRDAIIAISDANGREIYYVKRTAKTLIIQKEKYRD